MRPLVHLHPAPNPARRRSPGGAMAVALFALALWSAANPPPSLARPARLDVRGRIVTIGASPNLLAPGPFAGTFLLGDLDSGWMTLRRSVDGQVIQNLYVGKSTLGIAANPGGNEIYAADVRGSNVLILDNRTGGLTDSVLVGQSANLVRVSGDGRFVMATAFDPRLVTLFDRDFDYARRTIVLDDRPAGLVMTRERFPARAYVVGYDRGKIYSIEFNPSVFAVVDTLLTLPGASFIALGPDERTAYASAGRNKVVALDLDPGFVRREIPVGTDPLGLDVSPDGRYVMVANSGSASVSLIETDRMIVVDDVTVGSLPLDVLWVSNGRAYVVLQGDNALAVVDVIH
jgi:YVTN family beta-propeller protein